MRNFTYIEGCVDGELTTMDKFDNVDAINLSTGISTGFKQSARMAAEAVGYSPEAVGLSDKPSGVFARGGDTVKQARYGFIARIPFIEVIQIASEHYL